MPIIREEPQGRVCPPEFSATTRKERHETRVNIPRRSTLERTSQKELMRIVEDVCGDGKRNHRRTRKVTKRQACA
jgi:hypothetical protein